MNYEDVRRSLADRALQLALAFQEWDPDLMEDDLQSASDHLRQAGMLYRGPDTSDPETFVRVAFLENVKLDEALNMVPLAEVLAAETVGELAAGLTPPYLKV